MSGSSNGADGGHPSSSNPSYPPGYPPTRSSSYQSFAVRPVAFVDSDDSPQRSMPTPEPGFADPSTPDVGYSQLPSNAASTSAHYLPSHTGGPPHGRTPSRSSLSTSPGGSLQAGSVANVPLSTSPVQYPSGAYPPYSPPAISAQSVFGPRNEFCTHNHSTSTHSPSYITPLDPANAMPYPPTTPSRAPERDAAFYGTSADYYGGSMTTASCHPPGKGTIKTYLNFNVQRDVEALKKAMTGWTADHAVIIDIICARSEAQRLEIVRVYKQSFGREVAADAESSLPNGHLQQAILGLLSQLNEYIARELRDSIPWLQDNDESIIETFCTLSNYDITIIKDHYQRMFKRRLEKDVERNTSGGYRQLLVSLCRVEREEGAPLDLERARKDAAELHRAGVKSWGTDVSAFNRIIATQSYEQLRLVFREYNALANHTVMEAIKSEMSGDLRKGFLAVVKCIYSPPLYFAETLYFAMKGLGASDRVLKRIVLSRCEKDLEMIKQEYLDKYKVTLASDIQTHASGNYRKALLTIVQGNNLAVPDGQPQS